MLNVEKYVSKIVTLDMVNGKEITVRVLSVDDDIIKCSKPLMFVPIQDERDQTSTKIITIPYGHPLYQVDSIDVNVNHVITVLEPSVEQQNTYAKYTNSFVSAPANALDNLPDLSKFQL